MSLGAPLVVTGNDLVDGPVRDQVVHFLNQRSSYHFTQHPDWACAQDPHKFVGIGTVRDGSIVAWTLVRRRRLPLIHLSKYFGARGPVVQDLSVLGQHVANLGQALAADGLYLAFHPYVFDEVGNRMFEELCDLGFVRAPANDMYYKDTLAVDLTRSLQDIRADLRRSVKTQINKSVRLGVTVSRVTSDSDYLRFAKHYSLAMREKRIRVPSKFLALLSTFAASPHGYALQAFWRGESVAGIGLVACGSNLVYEWGYTSSSPEHRTLPLQHALQWQAIQLAKELGFVCYDLGGFWAEAGGDDPINHFKLGFTNVQRTSAGALTLYWRRRLAGLITRFN